MYLEKAYKNIKKRITNTEEYSEFLNKIVSDGILKDKFREVTTYEKDGKHISFASEVIENVDFINSFSNAFGLDKEFYNVALKAFENDNALNKVINIKFIETLYGNPNKEDLNNIDAIFTILESVFGLDAIINSFTDNKALDKRFKLVLKVEDDSLEYDFLSIINEIYEETNNKNYETIKNIIKNYSQRLNPYILPGLVKQIDERIENEESFKQIDDLRNRVVELVGTNINKKM